MKAGMLETVDHLEVGCSAWERLPADADYAPRGGTIIAIGNELDESTGEVRRRFATLKRDGANRLKKVWLDAEEIDLVTLQGPNPLTVRDLWRTLCREVAKRTGSPLPDEGDYIRMAEQLYEAVSVR